MLLDPSVNSQSMPTDSGPARSMEVEKEGQTVLTFRRLLPHLCQKSMLTVGTKNLVFSPDSRGISPGLLTKQKQEALCKVSKSSASCYFSFKRIQFP